MFLEYGIFFNLKMLGHSLHNFNITSNTEVTDGDFNTSE